MKKPTQIILVLLFAAIFMLFSVGCPNDTPGEDEGVDGDFEIPRYEEKIYWTGTIDDDFDGSSVVVIMDKYTGGVNKQHEESFFW